MLRSRGPLPQLADSEVLTIEIVGEILGFDTDKNIFGFFRNFYGHYFPNLTCRVTFARHAANLWTVKQSLFKHIADKFKDVVQVIDSFLYLCADLPEPDFPGSSKMWPLMEKRLVIKLFMDFDCMPKSIRWG